MASSSPSNFVSGFNSLAADPPASLPVDSDLVVILAALLCALICCVGLFSAVRCACLRRAASVSTTSHSMLQLLPSHDKGLKKKVLEALPKSTFTNKNNNNNNNNNNSCSSGVISGTTVNIVDDGRNLADCAICLTEFVEGDELRILPQCGHGFHVGCIDMWLGSHSSCPSCRQNLGVSGCKKCGELPAKSTGDIDLELGGFKSAATTTTTTTTTTTNQDDDDRFLA